MEFPPHHVQHREEDDAERKRQSPCLARSSPRRGSSGAQGWRRRGSMAEAAWRSRRPRAPLEEATGTGELPLELHGWDGSSSTADHGCRVFAGRRGGSCGRGSVPTGRKPRVAPRSRDPRAHACRDLAGPPPVRSKERRGGGRGRPPWPQQCGGREGRGRRRPWPRPASDPERKGGSGEEREREGDGVASRRAPPEKLRGGGGNGCRGQPWGSL
jgi:hypothetical protein